MSSSTAETHAISGCVKDEPFHSWAGIHYLFSMAHHAKMRKRGGHSFLRLKPKAPWPHLVENGSQLLRQAEKQFFVCRPRTKPRQQSLDV